MNYLDIKEVSELWKINVRSIQKYCQDGKIPGAKNIGRQWLIPEGAIPPADGRKKASRKNPGAYLYHFPILVYSPYYRTPEQLSTEEQQLLQIQKQFLEGNYSECLLLSRKLLTDGCTPAVTAGAYFTVGMSAILLGLHSEYKAAAAGLQELICDEDPRKEDFLLILCFMRYHTDMDSSRITRIDPHKLSADAIFFYKYSLLIASTLRGQKESEGTLKYLHTDAAIIDREHIVPAAFSWYCLMAVKYCIAGYAEEGQQLADRAVRIAVENNWLAHLAKFYNYNHSLFESVLTVYDKSAVPALKKISRATYRSWLFIYGQETGRWNDRLFTSSNAEFLLLISYGFSNREIAQIKKISGSKVSGLIRDLMELAGVSSRAELVQYARNLYDMMAPQA